MAEIIKTFRQSLPDVRLVGKGYTNADRGADGGYAHLWGEWFAHGWFAALESLAAPAGLEDADAYLGFMACDGSDAGFRYWIGLFRAPDAAVPEGFSCLDVPAGDAGVCWIRGRPEGDNIYGMHDACVAALKENGMGDLRAFTPAGGGAAASYFFERYACPRFTQADDEGRVVLDYALYLA